MEFTWSPLESMWSYGVHMESMGECKVHGLLGTYEITVKATYELVMMTIGQICHHLLEDPVLRQPLLHLFHMVYADSKFLDHLKLLRPLADQVPNQTKIQAIQAQPPWMTF
jgi:hypothetical protein